MLGQGLSFCIHPSFLAQHGSWNSQVIYQPGSQTPHIWGIGSAPSGHNETLLDRFAPRLVKERKAGWFYFSNKWWSCVLPLASDVFILELIPKNSVGPLNIKERATWTKSDPKVTYARQHEFTLLGFCSLDLNFLHTFDQFVFAPQNCYWSFYYQVILFLDNRHLLILEKHICSPQSCWL